MYLPETYLLIKYFTPMFSTALLRYLHMFTPSINLQHILHASAAAFLETALLCSSKLHSCYLFSFKREVTLYRIRS